GGAGGVEYRSARSAADTVGAERNGGGAAQPVIVGEAKHQSHPGAISERLRLVRLIRPRAVEPAAMRAAASINIDRRIYQRAPDFDRRYPRVEWDDHLAYGAVAAEGHAAVERAVYLQPCIKSVEPGD